MSAREWWLSEYRRARLVRRFEESFGGRLWTSLSDSLEPRALRAAARYSNGSVMRGDKLKWRAGLIDRCSRVSGRPVR